MTPKIILASKSPRRKELLRQLGLEFDVIPRDTEESFPSDYDAVRAVRYIAKQKALALEDLLHEQNRIILAADTVVVLDGEIIGKPEDAQEAVRTLTRLSGRTHQVITACALLHSQGIEQFHETTEVEFRTLLPAEINHYVDIYQPFDKAGAYGIQEWIGLIGLVSIRGSYTNVVGLPTTQVFDALNRLGALKTLDTIKSD